ncbi:MAG: hypothetical protein ACHQ2E_12360, partial [Gemmatimonadales bacterium]
ADRGLRLSTKRGSGYDGVASGSRLEDLAVARTGQFAILAVTALLVWGCGSSATTPTASTLAPEPPTPAVTPTLAATPVQAANPTPDLASLASQYATISANGDAAVAQCTRDRAAAASSLVQAKAMAQQCLTSTSGYVAQLKAINWGPVQPQADKVIAAVDAIEGLLGQMVNASSAATLRTEANQLVPASGRLLIAASALRSALGLPPVKL